MRLPGRAAGDQPAAVPPDERLLVLAAERILAGQDARGPIRAPSRERSSRCSLRPARSPPTARYPVSSPRCASGSARPGTASPCLRQRRSGRGTARRAARRRRLGRPRRQEGIGDITRCCRATAENITTSVPDHVYRNARVAAAQRDTSLSLYRSSRIWNGSAFWVEWKSSRGWRRCSTRCRPRSASSARARGSGRNASTTWWFIDFYALLDVIALNPAEVQCTRPSAPTNPRPTATYALSVQVLQESTRRQPAQAGLTPSPTSEAVRLIEVIPPFPC